MYFTRKENEEREGGKKADFHGPSFPLIWKYNGVLDGWTKAMSVVLIVHLLAGLVLDLHPIRILCTGIWLP